MDFVTVAIAKQMDDRRDILQYPDGPLNPRRPLTPTADATWGTPPSDLDHCVDGNPSTKTGVGETVVGGAGAYGYIVFDMESIRNVIVTAKIGAWSSTSTTNVYMEMSDNGTDWKYVHANIISAAGTATTNGGYNCTLVSGVHGRYFRLRFQVGAAATGYGELYTVTAYDIGD